MNYIVSKRRDYFKLIEGNYNFCDLKDLILPNVIGLDTETTGLECYHTDKGFKGDSLFAIQIGTGINNYLIDLEGGYSPEQVFTLIKDKTLVMQNAMFDLRFMFKHGYVPVKVKDILIASKILYNGGKDDVYTHNFKSIMLRELGILYDKTEQANIAKNKLNNKEAIEYCFNDVDKLLEAEKVMYNKLKNANQLLAYEIQCDATLPLAYMEMCGLPLNNIKWSEKIYRDKVSLKEVEEQMSEYIRKTLPKYVSNQTDLFAPRKLNLNFNSPIQMVSVFKDLKLNIINDKGKESLNSKVVSKIKHEFVDYWLKRQKLQKAISTFGENVLERSIEGRIYTSFNPMVDTSRISCRKGGINFLNFPRNKYTRDAFVALKGYKMVGADYSNQEVFCGADMHQDKVTLQSIKEGICLHCALAKVLYPEIADLSDKEIKDNHADKRQEAKSPRFAFQYGGSAFTIHKNEGIPMDRAIEIETAFKQLHEGIYTWGEKKLQEAINNGYIESVAGFKLYLPGYSEFSDLKDWYNSLDKEFWNKYSEGKKIYKAYYDLKNKETKTEEDLIKIEELKKLFKSPSYTLFKENRPNVSRYAKIKSEYFKLCLNNPAQSMAAFQTKSALILLFKIIVKRGDMWKARISNSPYDEILMEVKEELAETYKNILERCMIDEGNKWLKSGLFTMNADAVIGNSWYECH